jgi:hypothetical protein
MTHMKRGGETKGRKRGRRKKKKKKEARNAI